jgi:hypothetical protein
MKMSKEETLINVGLPSIVEGLGRQCIGTDLLLRMEGNGKNTIIYGTNTFNTFGDDQAPVGNQKKSKIKIVDTPAKPAVIKKAIPAVIIDDVEITPEVPEKVITEAVPEDLAFSKWFDFVVYLSDGKGGYIESSLGKVIQGSLNQYSYDRETAE